MLSHVDYRSGALADMEAIDKRATVIWDLSHSAGAVPVDLDGAAASATRSAAPTSTSTPARARSATSTSRDPDALRTPIQGWFGQDDQFAMERPYAPAAGITRFMAGTPPILVLAAVEEGVRITAEAGIEALREKSIAQTELMIALHDEWLAPLGFTLGSPRDPARRGSHVSLNHPEAWPICRALIERADVVPDFRGPDSVRLGIAPLYTRFVDVWDAIDRLRGPGRARRAARGRSDARAGHLDPAIASSVRRCISSSDMSSVCVASIQRWPYGSFSEPARSPWNWSDGRLTSVAPAAIARS